jgi:hypothetical protein
VKIPVFPCPAFHHYPEDSTVDWVSYPNKNIYHPGVMRDSNLDVLPYIRGRWLSLNNTIQQEIFWKEAGYE